MADSLVLLNNTDVPGNYVPSPPSVPQAVVSDSWAGQLYLSVEAPATSLAMLNESTDQLEKLIPVGGLAGDLYYDPVNGNVYSANVEGSNVTVLNGSTGVVVGSFPVGSEPDFIDPDLAQGLLFVANSGSKNVSVVQILTGGTLRSINLHEIPAALAYDPRNGYLYVTTGGDLLGQPCGKNITVFDAATGALEASIPLAYDCLEGLTYDLLNGEVYAANLEGNVTVLSGTSVLTAIPVLGGAGSPSEGDLDTANADLYFTDANYGLDVIDGSTNTYVLTRTGGTYPVWLSINNRTGKIFLSNVDSDNVSVFSVAGVAYQGSFDLGEEPTMSALDTASGNLYVLDAALGKVLVVSPISDRVLGSIYLGASPKSIVYDSASESLYASVGVTVQVIDPSLGAVTATIPNIYTYYYNEMVFDPINDYVFVGTSDGLSVINPATDTEVHTTNVGYCGVPWLGADPDHDQIYFAYATCGNFNGVAAINATNWALEATIPTGVAPEGVASDPATGQVFVADTGSSNLTVIDGSDHKVVGAIALGNAPTALCYDALDQRLYVAATDGDVDVVNASTDALVGEVAVGVEPVSDLCTLPSYQVVVSNEQSGTLSFLDPGSIGPVLSSVLVHPRNATVLAGHTSIGFNATANCTGGPCPAGTTYAWTLTNGLGTLNASNAAWVVFLAGARAGTETLFVNASLNGHSIQSFAVSIQVVLPIVTRVSISPTSGSVGTDSTQVLTSSIQCSLGAPCPTSGETYGWSKTNALGALSDQLTAAASFLAGDTLGEVAFFVNVTLNGVTVEGGPALLDITSTSVLSSISVSPSPTTLTAGGEENLTAAPACTSSCPGDTAYTWTLSNSLGSLNATTGAVVKFKAGTTAGTVAVFANGTLGGVRVQSTAALVTITTSALSTVTIAPSPESLLTGDTSTFTATSTCTSACPGTPTYLWTLSKDLGTLNTTTGRIVGFTAGSTPGTTALFVNATLDGKVVQSQADLLTISSIALASVAISPSPGSVPTGGSETFSVSFTCTGTAGCPAGATYAWSVTGGGTLSSTSGASVVFTAGSTPGQVGLFVNVSLDGSVMGTSIQIAIETPASQGSSPTPTLFGLSAYLVVGVLAIVIVAALVAAMYVRRRRPRSPEPSTSVSSEPAASTARSSPPPPPPEEEEGGSGAPPEPKGDGSGATSAGSRTPASAPPPPPPED